MDATVLSQLTGFLRERTSGGLFPIVAYGLDRERILLLTTSIAKLPLAMEVLTDATGTTYNLGRYLPSAQAEKVARENPHVVRIHQCSIEGLSAQDVAELGRVVGVFGAPYFRQRAVGLVDICGFSLLSHPEQLSQLYSLTNVLGSAIRRARPFCQRLGLRPEFGRSSTGDGFYVWHSNPGGNADVATFILLTCIVVQAEAMRLDGLPMRLKASYVIDSVFMLYDSHDDVTPATQPTNAVGAATNGAARLIAAAKPSQILIMDFRRPGQGQESMTPQTVVAQANELFRLEGAGAATLSFAPNDLLRVVDKHGASWHCWNIAGEVANSFGNNEARKVAIGLRPDPSPVISDIAFKANPDAGGA